MLGKRIRKHENIGVIEDGPYEKGWEQEGPIRKNNYETLSRPVLKVKFLPSRSELSD